MTSAATHLSPGHALAEEQRPDGRDEGHPNRTNRTLQTLAFHPE